MTTQVRFILLFSLLLLTGCAFSTHYLQDGAKTYPAEVASNVRVYAADRLDTKYTVIGSIAVDKLGDGNDAVEYLREEAGKLGANAVIGVRLTKLNSSAKRTGISGVAVRTE